MTFQQKWIFLNKVLYEMQIQFPSPELVGKWVWQGGPVLLSSRALGRSGGAALTLALSYHRVPVSRPWMRSIGP